MRSKSDEVYVLDLFAEILDEDYVWQKRFMTLVGDPGKYGRRTRLPVDAYFPDSNLIVEYKEKQHFQPVGIMDKRMTLSGVPRSEQRRIYDSRKEKWAADNNIKFIVVTYLDLIHKRNGRLLKDKNNDREIIKRLLMGL